jgi:hypothetical protein
MNIRCRDVDFRNGDALMRYISNKEFGWVATAEGEDAKVGDSVERIDYECSVYNVALPSFDEDTAEEEAKGNFQEDTCYGVTSAESDRILETDC